MAELALSNEEKVKFEMEDFFLETEQLQRFSEQKVNTLIAL